MQFVTCRQHLLCPCLDLKKCESSGNVDAARAERWSGKKLMEMDKGGRVGKFDVFGFAVAMSELASRDLIFRVLPRVMGRDADDQRDASVAVREMRDRTSPRSPDDASRPSPTPSPVAAAPHRGQKRARQQASARSARSRSTTPADDDDGGGGRSRPTDTDGDSLGGDPSDYNELITSVKGGWVDMPTTMSMSASDDDDVATHTAKRQRRQSSQSQSKSPSVSPSPSPARSPLSDAAPRSPPNALSPVLSRPDQDDDEEAMLTANQRRQFSRLQAEKRKDQSKRTSHVAQLDAFDEYSGADPRTLTDEQKRGRSLAATSRSALDQAAGDKRRRRGPGPEPDAMARSELDRLMDGRDPPVPAVAHAPAAAPPHAAVDVGADLGFGTEARGPRVTPDVAADPVRWKAAYRQWVRDKDALEFGLTSEAIDMKTLRPGQLTDILVRPVGEHTDKKTLYGRLHLWLQTVTGLGPDASETLERGALLFHDVSAIEDINDRYLALRSALDTLKLTMKSRNLLNFRSEEGKVRSQQVDGVETNLDNFFVQKLVALDIMSGTKSNLASRIQQLSSLRPSQQAMQAALDQSKEDYSTFATLYDLVLAKAKEWKLVRIDGRVWEPILTVKGQFTRAYKLWKDGEILEFVHRSAQPRSANPELWRCLYDRGMYWKQIAEVLKYSYDDEFPEVHPNRYWHAFANGIYDLEHDRFYEYGSLAFQHLAKNIVCCMYTAEDFENDEYEWHVQHGGGWYAIPTPPLEQICRVQEWERDEREWWYAGIGRTLYPAGYKENWAKMWIHLGRAGCGKTTTLKLASSFLPFHKIGLLNNNCEKVFTLQALENTWAWFGMDIKEDWNLDPTLWNTMVDTGLLVIARKYLSAKLVEFKQHGAVAANRLMNWADLSGQLVRRLFPHVYKKSPKGAGDPNLFRSMEKAKPAALKKCNLAYRAKCASHGNKILDSCPDLPENIRENMRVIRNEANPLMAFLESDWLAVDKSYWVKRGDFTNAFKRFAAEHVSVRGGRKLPTVNDTFFADVLESKNCYITSDVRLLQKLVPPENRSRFRDKTGGTWIVGCCLKDQETQQTNYKAPPPPNVDPVVSSHPVAAPPLFFGGGGASSTSSQVPPHSDVASRPPAGFGPTPRSLLPPTFGPPPPPTFGAPIPPSFGAPPPPAFGAVARPLLPPAFGAPPLPLPSGRPRLAPHGAPPPAVGAMPFGGPGSTAPPPLGAMPFSDPRSTAPPFDGPGSRAAPGAYDGAGSMPFAPAAVAATPRDASESRVSGDAPPDVSMHDVRGMPGR